MPGAVGEKTIAIEGMAELTRAFRMADRKLTPDLRAAFQSAADPVRVDAEARALAEIRRVGIPWSRMRVGVTRVSVYVAPVERGHKTRGQFKSKARIGANQKFAGKLLDEAMFPALDANRGTVIREAEDALADLARAWSRV